MYPKRFSCVTLAHTLCPSIGGPAHVVVRVAHTSVEETQQESSRVEWSVPDDCNLTEQHTEQRHRQRTTKKDTHTHAHTRTTYTIPSSMTCMRLIVACLLLLLLCVSLSGRPVSAGVRSSPRAANVSNQAILQNVSAAHAKKAKKEGDMHSDGSCLLCTDSSLTCMCICVSASE